MEDFQIDSHFCQVFLTCIFRPGRKPTSFTVLFFLPSCSPIPFHSDHERKICLQLTYKVLINILTLQVDYMLGLFFFELQFQQYSLSLLYCLFFTFCSFYFKVRCFERFCFPRYCKTHIFTKPKHLSSAVVSATLSLQMSHNTPTV